MGVVFKKTEELKHLLIGKSLSEQKEIVVNFFYENRKLNKHFKMFYKATKDIFEKSSLGDYYAQEFIDKTFINRELMFPCYTLNELHRGTNWEIDDEDFETYTVNKAKEHSVKLIWKDDIEEKQDDESVKRKIQ